MRSPSFIRVTAGTTLLLLGISLAYYGFRGTDSQRVLGIAGRQLLSCRGAILVGLALAGLGLVLTIVELAE